MVLPIIVIMLNVLFVVSTGADDNSTTESYDVEEEPYRKYSKAEQREHIQL